MTIDWKSLGFAYRDCNSHVRSIWRDGRWGEIETQRDPYLRLHMGATALHYGQSAFEGLKAFSCKDGGVRVFRMDENAKRMQRTAERILMPVVPPSLFQEAIFQAVKDNREFVPPYGTGGALYIRPLLFGSGAQIGVQPSDEFTFLVLVIPVGNYYTGGLSPVSAIVIDDYDRTAPLGVGNVKVAGNYAAGLKPSRIAREQGIPIVLYLDSKEHRYVDEFGTSNFIAITADNAYLTPDSQSVLPSVTNKTLMTLAVENGLDVVRRPIEFDEISQFTEVGACGTAVVITPVNRIVRGSLEIEIGPRDGCGPVLEELYHQVRAIQIGEAADHYGWTRLVE